MLSSADVDEGDVDNLLHRAVRPGAVDPAALAEGLAHPSEFEDSNEEQVAKVRGVAQDVRYCLMLDRRLNIRD